MPSPFPGMDPYLEQDNLWRDVHLALISAIQRALAPAIAPRYYVALDERVYLSVGDPTTYVGRPDASLIRKRRRPERVVKEAAAVFASGLPVTVELPLPDEVRERFLEIREAATHELVTVIELLSPTNKSRSDGRSQYVKKRLQVLHSATSLVEIDMLRGGEPMPMANLPQSDYRILVSRAWERPVGQLYPFGLRDPIPEVPIPLRAGEPEPKLNLNQLLHELYDQVRYDLRIDYHQEPDPPLREEDAAWVDRLLREVKVRG